MILDFHYMISVDDIHGNNIITTSIEYIYLLNSSLCLFTVWFVTFKANKLHSKYKYKEVERQSGTVTVSIFLCYL